MVERGVMTEEATAPDGGSAPPSRLETLEQRVCRLEDAVAALQDTGRLEERVAERVARRLSRPAPPAAQLAPDSAGVLVNAGRQLLPAALSVMRTRAEAADSPLQASAAGTRSWILFEAYAEARAMVRMFFDNRYRVGWTAWIIPAAALFVFLCSWLLVSPIWIIGSLLDKAIDLVLAFLVYKVLSREVQRYRQTVAGLPPP
jgi:hypothetical protein